MTRPGGGAPVQEWPPARRRQLAELVAAALPEEELSEDELLSCCWEGPGTVLGLADGTGAVALTPLPPGAPEPGAAAHLALVAVHPGARRRGGGRALIGAAEAWAWSAGASELRTEPPLTAALWPGVDATATGARALLRACGFDEVGVVVNRSLPTEVRAPTPAGVDVRRVVDDADAVAVDRLVATAWPAWRAGVARAVEQGCCHGAFAPEGPAPAGVGLVCHSVNRTGWVGPLGVTTGRRGAGIGSALLSAACRDLMIADVSRAEIHGDVPAGFVAARGAAPSRVFHRYRKRRPF